MVNIQLTSSLPMVDVQWAQRVMLRCFPTGAPVVLPFRGADHGHGSVPRPLHRRRLHTALLQAAAGEAHHPGGHGGRGPRPAQQPHLDPVRHTYMHIIIHTHTHIIIHTPSHHYTGTHPTSLYTHTHSHIIIHTHPHIIIETHTPTSL